MAKTMEVCSLCCDTSKTAYLNVETMQLGTEFIPISDMTKVFKDLEQIWNANEQKNICIDCLQELQSSYLFYKKCLKSKELNESARHVQNKTKTVTGDEEKVKYFKCCDQRFATKFQLNKHKQHAHGANFRFPCRFCKKRFLSKRSVRFHEVSHKKIKKSYCELCQRHFNYRYRANFLKHQQRHNDIECYYCNRVFTEVELTKKHIADRHEKNKKLFSCVNCKNGPFESRKILLRHYRTVHATTIPIFCGQCDEPFKGNEKEKLMTHLVDCNKKKSNENDEYWDIEHLIDDDLNLTTEWLNYEMLSDDYLNVDNGESMVEEFLDDAFEMLVGHSEELKCHLCFTVFKTSRDLIMHDITNHDNVKREPDNKPLMKENPCYKCPRCKDEFSKQSTLTIHLAHHHNEYVLFCNECGAAYNEITKLRAHRKEHQMENMTSTADRQNIRDGKNLCTLCDKYFTTNGLKYHLKTHSNVVRAFICPFCDKKFIANTNLNAHIRIRHSETKQHPCSHCDRRFGSMDHLKKHTASIHLHIRNFKCDSCDKSFRQKSHLNQHQWQHNGVKQYQCSLCIKAYTSKPSLRNHMLKVHSLVE